MINRKKINIILKEEIDNLNHLKKVAFLISPPYLKDIYYNFNVTDSEEIMFILETLFMQKIKPIKDLSQKIYNGSDIFLMDVNPLLNGKHYWFYFENENAWQVRVRDDNGNTVKTYGHDGDEYWEEYYDDDFPYRFESNLKNIVKKVIKENLISESTDTSEMLKPSGDKLEWPKCPEGQYWDIVKKKCVNYGFSEDEIPKTYKDTYSGMDDYFDQQQKSFNQKLNDKKKSDKILITPLLEKAKTWWRNWLNNPKTKSKHMEMFGLSLPEVETKFKNYLKVIDNIELVMINRYGNNKNIYGFVSDAYIDSNLKNSSLGHIFDKEYDVLIQNGGNEITAWLGALVSTVSGGNDINDCRVFVPSPLIGGLSYYEQTFAHEIQHLLEDRVGPLTSKEVISKSFPIKKGDNGKIELEDLKMSVEVLKNAKFADIDKETVDLEIPEELKMDLTKGIKDLSSIHKPKYGKISEKKAKDRIKDLIDSLILNSKNLSYNCDHSEKTANLAEIRNKLNLKPGEKMDWIGVLFSYWNDGWVNEEQQIDTLPVYRTLACWILNNFTPDLKTLFENLDNFVMNKEKNMVNPTQPVNNKNLDLAHIIRKNIKLL